MIIYARRRVADNLPLEYPFHPDKGSYGRKQDKAYKNFGKIVDNAASL